MCSRERPTELSTMSRYANPERRRFLGSAALALAAAPFLLDGRMLAQTGAANSATSGILPGTFTSFQSIKQIDAGALNVGYAEAGPPNGPAVILLHGWPYDIYAFVDVVPLLAAAGFRVVAPWLRGYGT